MSYQPYLDWLFRSTFNTSALIIVIFLIKLIAKNKLSVRWHSALWLVLVFRMVFPWGLDTAVGLDGLLARLPSAEPALEIHTLGAVSVDSITQTQLAANPSFYNGLDRWQVLLALWALGAAFLIGLTLWHHFKLVHSVRKDPFVKDEDILLLLESCKRHMGTNSKVDVVATRQLNTPAVLGLVNPRILIPEHLLRELTHTDLRHIFLHELAHIKRYDALIRWLTVFLQAVYWFNPLVWLAFRSMRQDRELAADGLTLSLLNTSETRPYGFTLVRLLERFSKTQRLASISSFAESNSSIRKRVKMISDFQRESYRWSPAALAAFALVLSISLLSGNTSATEAQSPPPERPRVSMPEEQLAFLNSPVKTSFHFQTWEERQAQQMASTSSETGDTGSVAYKRDRTNRVKSDRPEVAKAHQASDSAKTKTVDAPREIPRFNLFQKETDLWSIPKERIADRPGKNAGQSNRSSSSVRVETREAPGSSAAELARQINEYNADPKNKYNRIICRQERPTGSNLPKLVCRKESEIRRRSLSDQMEMRRLLRQ